LSGDLLGRGISATAEWELAENGKRAIVRVLVCLCDGWRGNRTNDYSDGKRMDARDDSPIVQVTLRRGPLGEGERCCESEEEEMSEGFHDD
jgi:hypothetical protein